MSISWSAYHCEISDYSVELIVFILVLRSEFFSVERVKYIRYYILSVTISIILY